MLLAPLRWALRIAVLVVAVIVLYFAVTLVQVWLTSRQYDPHPAGAILVMGAAQYDCVPSPDLRARLDQALTLYHQGYAHLIMVTGSKEPGDKCTEAESGAMYLESEGRAGSAILEAGGDDSYENIADAAAGAAGPQRARSCCHHGPVPRGPLHGHRLDAVADAVADAHPDLADHGAGRRVPYFVKEAVGVGFGPDHRLQPPGVAARAPERRGEPVAARRSAVVVVRRRRAGGRCGRRRAS